MRVNDRMKERRFFKLKRSKWRAGLLLVIKQWKLSLEEAKEVMRRAADSRGSIDFSRGNPHSGGSILVFLLSFFQEMYRPNSINNPMTYGIDIQYR